MTNNIDNVISNAKPPSKKEWESLLLEKLRSAIENGLSNADALALLTTRQYDFLVDRDIDLDHLILSPEQKDNIRSLMNKGVGRPTFPNGYEKKYPIAKRVFYSRLVDFIESIGGVVEDRPKLNYRDIDFVLENTKYKIIFSIPKK